MRSRFSAFALARVLHLVNTRHPAKRSPNESVLLMRSMASCEWQKLEILHSTGGNVSDNHGEVRFRAHYIEEGIEDVWEETALFTKQDGQWFYVDGTAETNLNVKLNLAMPRFRPELATMAG